METPLSTAGSRVGSGVGQDPAKGAALANAVGVIEPIWMTVAAFAVYMAYLLQLHPGIGWFSLAACLLPTAVRAAWSGFSALRTPFDLPIAVLLAGGFVGIAVSPNREMSLGAFQSLLAISLFYYSMANHRRPEKLLPVGLVLVVLGLGVASALALSQGPLPTVKMNAFSARAFSLFAHLPKLPQPTDLSTPLLTVNHGLLTSLLALAAIGLGLALFERRKWLKLMGIAGSIFLVVAIIGLANDSVGRLVSGKSLQGRIELWQDTVDMLKRSPFSGLGLGAWSFVHNGRDLPARVGHTHNAYLELLSSYGALGLAALLLAAGIFFKLAWDIARSPRSSRWRGLGMGVVLSTIFVALVGLFESAPVGIPAGGTSTYFWVASPLPWFTMSVIVLCHRSLRNEAKVVARGSADSSPCRPFQ